ncbi:unnamed protein product [Protopolystoma xenopodis]|uniref:Ion transport domain-containing protein n=1 Tax=Protopolystoma xenopodis TaxID=117903 RepID=A0A448WMN4_9PLAT|nr:unnamed protein product [Protopolystoma xenopodis]
MNAKRSCEDQAAAASILVVVSFRCIGVGRPRFRKLVMFMFRTAAMVSIASVSANTPTTFKQLPSLMYVTFVLDIVVAMIFTIEMFSKMYIQGTFSPAACQVMKDW